MAFFDSLSRLPIDRRRFLKGSLFCAGGLALYSSEFERHRIEVTQREIYLSGLPAAFDGLRIAQLSDIHMEEFTETFFLRQAVERVNQLQPDAVVLTGDFVSDGPRSRGFAAAAAWTCANLLSELKCRQLYAVLGNHDVSVGRRRVSAALKANGIAVLLNACLPMERSGGRIWVAGVDDPLMGHPNLDMAVPASIRSIPNEPIVLLCHAPDYADDVLRHPAGKGIGLMLSGHTHGGQICLPLLGPLTLPDLGKKYVEGWFRLGGLQLVVNRGIGTVGLPLRIDCPPEISLITLRRG
jgi:predicted MPP superfamily phosphohydrolase